MYVCMSVCVYIYVCVCMYECVCLYICVCVCVFVSACVHMRVCVYTTPLCCAFTCPLVGLSWMEIYMPCVCVKNSLSWVELSGLWSGIVLDGIVLVGIALDGKSNPVLFQPPLIYISRKCADPPPFIFRTKGPGPRFILSNLYVQFIS